MKILSNIYYCHAYLRTRTSQTINDLNIVKIISLLKWFLKAVTKKIQNEKVLIIKMHICLGFTHFLLYHVFSCTSFNREVPK